MMPRKPTKSGAEKAVRDIYRATRRPYSVEEKIRIVPNVCLQRRVQPVSANMNCDQSNRYLFEARDQAAEKYLML